MDKKLNRVIGYIPNKVATKVFKKEEPVLEQMANDSKDETVAKVNIAVLIEAELGKAKKIVNWINGHKEFKWGAMCTKLGIDRGNFQRTLKSAEPTIKIEFIGKIEDFLKKYGYK